MSLDKTTLALNVGESATLTATVLPETATEKSVTWSSSDEKVATVKDEKVATVSSAGVVTGVASGTCTVTATAHNGVKSSCGVTVQEKPYTDLSASGTSNCYIVSSKDKYKFKGTVKGNSSESVGTPATAEVLWESFGTSVKPSVGDIVSDVSYSDGYVRFRSGADGNALIAVKNSSGTILWSPVDAEALTDDKVENSVSNPMTFIYNTYGVYPDWSGNNQLWQQQKTKYDPCPTGWKVPEAGIWSKAALNEAVEYTNFSCVLDSNGYKIESLGNEEIWYPACLYHCMDGEEDGNLIKFTNIKRG